MQGTAARGARQGLAAPGRGDERDRARVEVRKPVGRMGALSGENYPPGRDGSQGGLARVPTGRLGHLVLAAPASCLLSGPLLSISERHCPVTFVVRGVVAVKPDALLEQMHVKQKGFPKQLGFR